VTERDQPRAESFWSAREPHGAWKAGKEKKKRRGEKEWSHNTASEKKTLRVSCAVKVSQKKNSDEKRKRRREGRAQKVHWIAYRDTCLPGMTKGIGGKGENAYGRTVCGAALRTKKGERGNPERTGFPRRPVKRNS